MTDIRSFLKNHLLPKKLYLHFSAAKKYKKAHQKGEVELRLLPFLVDPEKLSIDVGANKGLYTYYLAKLSRNVIAFEANPELCRFLKGAVAKNVTVINKGLSDCSSLKELHTPIIKNRSSFNTSTLEPAHVSNKTCRKQIIETADLDSYEFENIGFIKIDVEGHEMKVLKGAEKSIARSKPAIQIEILADKSGIEDQEVVRFLKAAGYEMLTLHNNLLHFYTPLQQGNPGRNYIFLPR